MEPIETAGVLAENIVLITLLYDDVVHVTLGGAHGPRFSLVCKFDLVWHLAGFGIYIERLFYDIAQRYYSEVVLIAQRYCIV